MGTPDPRISSALKCDTPPKGLVSGEVEILNLDLIMTFCNDSFLYYIPYSIYGSIRYD